MATKLPLFFEYDIATSTPSSIAEFTVSNVVGVVNGGTGVSSLAALAASLAPFDISATTVSAAYLIVENGVSAASVSAIYVYGGVGVSATTVSSTYILAETGVSSTNVSASNQITGRELMSLGNSFASNLSSTRAWVETGVSAATVSSTYVIASTAVSSNTFTSPDDGGGDHFYMKQETGATYPNLIEAETGLLTIMANNSIVLRSATGEARAFFRPNGSCDLYWDNSKKLETHNKGALVYGGVSAITVSSTYQYVEGAVSATSVSATVIIGADAMPIPAPFGYVQTDTAGTNSSDMQYFASGADTTNIVSNAIDILWNDTLKEMQVMKAGTYEIRGDLILDSGSQNDIVTITARKNNAVVFTIEPRMYGATGPLDISFYHVLVASASDRLTIGIEMAGAKTAHLEIGSTMTVKRLK